MEKGTLYQIRNLIDRRNITKHPKSDVNAAEDFLEVEIISYILTAVMTYLGMNSLNEMPSTEFLSQDIWMSDDKERRELLTKFPLTLLTILLIYPHPSAVPFRKMRALHMTMHAKF